MLCVLACNNIYSVNFSLASFHLQVFSELFSIASFIGFRSPLMQMSTLRGWHGGLLEEDPKEELKLLIPKGTVARFVIHI